MNIKQTSFGFLLAICSAGTVAVFAQTTAVTNVGKSLVGSWLVTVEGDVETRTLIVAEEAPTSDGALLEAKYGMTSTRQGPISAKMLRVSDKRQLILTTQAGTKIEAAEQSDGSFKGTFALKNGGVKEVTIIRISEEMRQQLAQAGTSPSIQKPGPDVPALCAAFWGKWTGNWPSFGPTWLWVVEVDVNCNAKYAQRKSDAIPKTFRTAKIEQGVLLLKEDDRSTDSYELHSDELWARHTGSDGANNAVFRKVSIEPK
jgi:hypothetical protein